MDEDTEFSARRDIDEVWARIKEFFILPVVVEGTSMSPTYLPDERPTALRKWRRVRTGDVVVVRDPRDAQRWMLKRCVGRVRRLTCAATTRWTRPIRGSSPAPRDVAYIVLPSSSR